jgi:release factor glutamine methyltransferase
VGVRDYEPRAALDGGPTGLEVVKQIIVQAGGRLKPGGQLILEIGAPQEPAVRKLVEDRTEYELLPTIRDYAGHPRVVSARAHAPHTS